MFQDQLTSRTLALLATLKRHKRQPAWNKVRDRKSRHEPTWDSATWPAQLRCDGGECPIVFFLISPCYIGHHLSYLFGGFGVPEKSVRNSTGSNSLCFSTVLHTAYPSIFIMCFFSLLAVSLLGGTVLVIIGYIWIYNSIYRIISQLVGVGILLLYHVLSICNSLNLIPLISMM